MTTRRERVLLELEDQFTSGMIRAAGATQLLNRELNSLSGSSVETSRDSDRVQRSLAAVGAEATRTTKALGDGRSEIDRYSGRLGLLVKTAAVLGPALIPIGAAGIPAIAGLTMGLGAAAGAAGVALVAFHGVGDALKAIDAYQIEPTTANLEKMRAELDKLGPAGADFARYLDSLDPTLRDLQNLTREGFLPGVEAGIDGLLQRLPELRRFLFDLSTELGDLTASAGEALGGEKFDAFFAFLERDGVPTLHQFAEATGNVALGLANMIAAFAPVSRDFTGGLVEMSQAFADWSAGLSGSDGFREFVDYLQQTGPRVADLVGQLALALAAVAEAAAPVGSVLLPALTAVAKVVETIAKSDLGTPLFAGIAAMSALRLATQAWANVSKSSVAGFVAGQGRAAASIMQVVSAQDRAMMSASQLAAVQQRQTRTTVAAMGRAASVAAGLAIAMTGAADGVGLSNTAMLGLTGTMAGPWGTAAGTAIGLTMDAAAANNDLEAAIRQVDDAMKSMDTSQMKAALDDLNAGIDAFHEKTTVDFSWNPFTMSKEKIDAVLAGVNELATGTEAAAEAKRRDAEAAIQDSEAHDRYMAAGIGAARVARQTRTEIAGLTAAMEENRSAALGAFDAVTQYGRALDAARAQARKSEAGINASTEAGRKNRDALSQLAAAWNNQSDAVRNNVGKWREARKAFIDTATAMGVPIEKAKTLADRLMEIPKSVVTKIEANADPAIRAARELDQAIRNIPREWQTNYRINTMRTITTQNMAGGRDGDPSTPYADGGFTGRGPRQRVAGIVHAGEVVLPQDIVRRDKAMLMSRYGFLPNMRDLPGFADGGYARTPGGAPMFDFVGPVNAAASALGDLADSSLKELKVRQKLLQNEVDRDKEQLSNLRQMRASLAQSVRDLITGGDLFSINQAPSGAPSWLNNSDLSREDKQFLIDQYNAQVAAAGSVTSNVGGMLAEGRERLNLIRKLRGMGVDGPALAKLATEPIEVLRELASNRREARQFDRQYEALLSLGAQAGSYVGSAVYGKDIKAQLDELKGLRQDVRRVEDAIKHQTHENKQNSDDNARQTAAGVNRPVVNAVQRVL